MRVARLRRRDIPPAFLFRDKLFVELFQYLVLKAAALAGVQFKHLPLVGAQAGMDEKPERALREFLQPADGRLQRRAEKFFRERWRKFLRRFRLAQCRKFFRERFERGNFEQYIPICPQQPA